MKKLVLALAAASTLVVVAPAVAQPYGGQPYAGQDRWRHGWSSMDQRQAQLERRIDNGVRSGQITRGEAMRLRGEFRSLVRLEDRYRANGLSSWERADLDRRFDMLSAKIRYERWDAERYGYGYGPDNYRR